MKTTFGRLLSLLLSLALLLGPALPARAEQETPASADPVTITLDKTSLEIRARNDDTVLAAVTGGTAGMELTWTSSDPEIATVRRDETDHRRAYISAVAPGVAVITVSAGTASAACTVTVPIDSVSLNASKLMIDAGSSQKLLVTISPSNASETNRAVTWTSTHPEVADVASDGTVRGLTPGTTNVTAVSVLGGVKSGVCTVTVSGIVLSETAIDLIVNTSTRLTRTAFGDAQDIADWEWRSSNTSICRIDPSTGTITGLSEGTCTVTCISADERFSASCEVQVIRNEAATIRYTLRGTSLCFSSILPNMRSASRSLTTGSGAGSTELNYITGLSVRTGEGTLYENYIAESDTGAGVAGSYRYYDSSSGRRIDNVYYVPRAGFSGTATITYTGYSVGGAFFTGEILVTVQPSSTSLAYSTHEGAPVQFNADEFSAFCEASTGRSMYYLTFTLPPVQYGTLRYNRIDDELYESMVGPSDRYYRGERPSLNDVYFVPRIGYTGYFDLEFTGINSAGETFTGSTRITVTGLSGFDSDEIGYSVISGQRVGFNANDFSEACYGATGAQLSYIRFTGLPPGSQGALYYGSGTSARVTTGTFFYYSPSSSSTRLIRNLAFTAATGYQGSFTIPYIGVNAWNEEFSGSVRITVTPDVATEVTYSIGNSQTLHLDPDDFSRASYAVLKEDFSHLYFNGLPTSTQGVMAMSGTPITSTSSAYYRTGSSRLLQTVSFTPAGNYTGVVMLPYTAYILSGKHFDGVLSISVSTASSSVGSLSYFTSGTAVRFRSEDFAAAVSGLLSGTLTSVRFTLPDTAVGRLCYNYVSPTQYSVVSPSTSYTAASISEIAFQPKAGYRGTVHIAYTAANNRGGTFTGTVMIQVAPPSASTRFRDMNGYAWAVPAVDFLGSCGILNGTAPNIFSPGDNMRRGDFVLMLSRAFSFGELKRPSFPDVPENAYYAPAVAGAQYLGIVAGDENGNFNPSASISRQEAAVLLYRSMSRSGTMPAGSFSDLLPFSDRGDVANYAINSLGSLVRLGVFQGDSVGRLNPRAALTRAEMATLFYRAIT